MGASVRLRLLDTRVPIFPAAPTTATLIEGSSSTVLPYRGLSCLLLVIGDSFVTVRRGVAGRCGRGRGRMRTGGRGAAVEGPLDGGSAGRWVVGRMRGRAEGSAGGQGGGPRDRWRGGGGAPGGGRGARGQAGGGGRGAVGPGRRAGRVPAGPAR